MNHLIHRSANHQSLYPPTLGNAHFKAKSHVFVLLIPRKLASNEFLQLHRVLLNHFWRIDIRGF